MDVCLLHFYCIKYKKKILYRNVCVLHSIYIVYTVHIWGRGEMHTGFWWGKPMGKRPLGRTRCTWEDDIKMDLQEVGCGGYGLDQAGSGQGQVAGTCECGNEPSDSMKCREFPD